MLKLRPWQRCIVCGRMFRPKSSSQKTCCEKCAQERVRTMQRTRRVRGSDGARELGPASVDYGSCVDCGATTQYRRCLACKEKFLARWKAEGNDYVEGSLAV